MRNARSNKVREYRKSLRGAKGTISLWKLFDHLHPVWDDQWDKNPRRWRWPDCCNWYDQRGNIRKEWFSKIARCPAHWYRGMGNAPANFRRDLNRKQRNKEKMALRMAVINDNLEDFVIPRHRRDANWLWW